MNDQFHLTTLTSSIFNHLLSFCSGKDLVCLNQTNSVLQKRIVQFVELKCNSFHPQICTGMEKKYYLQFYEFVSRYSSFYFPRYKERMEKKRIQERNIEGPIAEICINYAKTAGGVCRVCYKSISKKELRFGGYFKIESGPYEPWYNGWCIGPAHFECFTFPDYIYELEQLELKKKLKKEDLLRIQQKLLLDHMVCCFKQEKEEEYKIRSYIM